MIPRVRRSRTGSPCTGWAGMRMTPKDVRVPDPQHLWLCHLPWGKRGCTGGVKSRTLRWGQRLIAGGPCPQSVLIRGRPEGERPRWQRPRCWL